MQQINNAYILKAKSHVAPGIEFDDSGATIFLQNILTYINLCRIIDNVDDIHIFVSLYKKKQQIKEAL